MKENVTRKKIAYFDPEKSGNFFTGERHRKISFIQRAQQHFVNSSDNRTLTFTRQRPTPQNVKLLEPQSLGHILGASHQFLIRPFS